MTWPTVTINTTHMDASGDDPSQARAEIKQMADNVNTMRSGRGAASGVAPLDGSSLVPTANLPNTAANKGGTGQTTYTVGDILYASATGVLSKLVAGTLGYVLTSNGPGNAPSWQLAGGGLTSGVRMLFQNSTAPTGWTKETNSAYNNVAMRIVTGSVSNGGADDFTTVFGSGKATAGHTLNLSQIPSHEHGQNINSGTLVVAANRTGGVSGGVLGYQSITGTNNNGRINTDSSGSTGAHSHGLALDLKYRDFILAQKD